MRTIADEASEAAKCRYVPFADMCVNASEVQTRRKYREVAPGTAPDIHAYSEQTVHRTCTGFRSPDAR